MRVTAKQQKDREAIAELLHVYGCIAEEQREHICSAKPPSHIQITDEHQKAVRKLLQLHLSDKKYSYNNFTIEE